MVRGRDRETKGSNREAGGKVNTVIKAMIRSAGGVNQGAETLNTS